ncbi:MAG: CehA/McbA family metallohydrolase, partial [Actinomycetota bacterium]
SGDSHVHFLSAQGSMLEQQGEDLNVVNLLQSQWGSLFTNTEDVTGSRLVSDDGRHVTWVSQENRQPLFGHLALWGLHSPVMPWCTVGPPEAELGAWHETTLSDWADRTHEQGGTVVIAHFPQPNGEPPVLIATGRADAIEMIIQRPAFHEEYYSYLNAGYRLPLVGGTDKMSSDVPVGLYRTYAKVGDEGFSHEAWCGAVRAGRTFLSAGPMLHLEVDGREPGDAIRIPGGGMASVSAVAESVFPMGSLEIIVNGEVVASADTESNDRRMELRADVRVDEDSWIAARCGGAGYFDGPVHRDPWSRPIFAHTSPVYVACGDGEWSRFDRERLRTMASMIDAGIERLRSGRHYPPERITHHHGETDHLAFLERPFLEARQRVRDRLERRA